MKKMNRNILVLTILTAFIGLCFLSVSNSRAADGKKPTNRTNNLDESNLPGSEWRDEENDVESGEGWEEHDEDAFDEGQELEWELAEQSLLAHSIEHSAEVALDEVKTAVVAATLLIEHSDADAAIDTLRTAIKKTSSADIKRALSFKLIEAHLENDNSSAAIGIATQLMVGE